MAKYDFLKLTRTKDAGAVYIEAGHLSAMIPLLDGKGTDVYLTGDDIPVTVLETPDQILSLLME